MALPDDSQPEDRSALSSRMEGGNLRRSAGGLSSPTVSVGKGRLLQRLKRSAFLPLQSNKSLSSVTRRGLHFIIKRLSFVELPSCVVIVLAAVLVISWAWHLVAVTRTISEACVGVENGVALLALEKAGVGSVLHPLPLDTLTSFHDERDISSERPMRCNGVNSTFPVILKYAVDGGLVNQHVGHMIAIMLARRLGVQLVLPPVHQRAGYNFTKPSRTTHPPYWFLDHPSVMLDIEYIRSELRVEGIGVYDSVPTFLLDPALPGRRPGRLTKGEGNKTWYEELVGPSLAFEARLPRDSDDIVPLVNATCDSLRKAIFVRERAIQKAEAKERIEQAAARDVASRSHQFSAKKGKKAVEVKLSSWGKNTDKKRVGRRLAEAWQGTESTEVDEGSVRTRFEGGEDEMGLSQRLSGHLAAALFQSSNLSRRLLAASSEKNKTARGDMAKSDAPAKKRLAGASWQALDVQESDLERLLQNSTSEYYSSKKLRSLPIVIDVGQPSFNFAFESDAEASWSALRTLRFAPHIVETANLIINRMRMRGLGSFDGVHLRLEADAPWPFLLGWNRTYLYYSHAMELAGASPLLPTYVASGLFEDDPKNRLPDAMEQILLPHSSVVVSKESVLTVEERAAFGTEELAAVDYLVLLQGRTFVGMVMSSYSFLISEHRQALGQPASDSVLIPHVRHKPTIETYLAFSHYLTKERVHVASNTSLEW